LCGPAKIGNDASFRRLNDLLQAGFLAVSHIEHVKLAVAGQVREPPAVATSLLETTDPFPTIATVGNCSFRIASWRTTCV
jgi:hypothetical protein